MRNRRVIWLALAVVAVAAFGSVSLAGAASGKKGAEMTKVTVQLKWVPQSQFAGFYSAKERGYYEAAGLDVTLKPGGPDITPEQVVASKQAEFGLGWLPALLAARDKGTDLVNIAQLYTRSGMTELTWKDSGITSLTQMKGKTVGVWCCGNENELFAAFVKNGIDPKNKDDVTIFNQPFNMNEFLQRKIDAAAAMTYNELAQVLETKNPKTGKLYKLSDLNVITMESLGTAMLEDGIYARGDWLKDAKNRATAVKFLTATFKGWVYCRDHVNDCVNDVLKNGSLLGKGHQTWQMNEVNALIWPAKLGVGVMSTAAFTRTAVIAKQFKVIAKAPSGAYRTDLAKAAVAAAKKQGFNPYGLTYKKPPVVVTPGGK